jgi:hypothetical protein
MKPGSKYAHAEIYGGISLSITLPGESQEIRDKIADRKQFTHGVSNRDLKPKGNELCLLAFNETHLDSLWLARFSLSAKTESARRRGSFVEHVSLGALDVRQCPLEIRATVQDALQRRESRLLPEVWKTLLGWIRSQRPESADDIQILELLQVMPSEPIYDPLEQLIAEQWDATGAAMEFAGFDRKQILPTLSQHALNTRKSFVLNFAEAKTFEEDILPVEMRNVPGWELFQECQGGIVQLRRKATKGQPDHELTVINANKKPLEECLGVDLIFHQTTFNACVLIQYKRLTRQGVEWYFDLNDEQFSKQLVAIKEFKQRKMLSGSPAAASDYRISVESFFFKFCKEQISNDESKTLFEGWYVPVEHLELIRASKASLGGHGGRRLTEQSAGRWFSNTDFAPLLSSGWIGTHGETTALLGQMIQASIEGKRALVFALAGRSAP